MCNYNNGYPCGGNNLVWLLILLILFGGCGFGNGCGYNPGCGCCGNGGYNPNPGCGCDHNCC